jgi:hypothetical protein
MSYFRNKKSDGFEFVNLEDVNNSYFYKHLLVMGVLFFFFLFERSMKIYTYYKTLVSEFKNLII